jgi:hypothetical protein
VQEDCIRIRIIWVFKELAQIAGLLGVERLAIIIWLKRMEYCKLVCFINRDAR